MLRKVSVQPQKGHFKHTYTLMPHVFPLAARHNYSLSLNTRIGTGMLVYSIIIQRHAEAERSYFFLYNTK